MCQAGGPRCSNHALKTLIKDKAKVKEAMSSEDDKQIAESQDKASRSLIVWYSTPQGQEHLNDKIDGAETEEDRQKYTKILDKAKQIRYEQSEDGRAYRAQIAEDKKFESEFKKIPRKEREERKELVDKLMSAQKKAPNAFTQQALDSSLQWSGEKPQWYYEEADATEKNYGTKPEIIDVIDINGKEMAVMWSDNSSEKKEITLQMEDGYDLSTLEYRDMETGEKIGYVKTMIVTDRSLKRSYGDDEYSTYRFYENKNYSLLINEKKEVKDDSYRGYHTKYIHPLETAKTEEEILQAKKKIWANSHKSIDKFPKSVDRTSDSSLYNIVNLQEKHAPEDPEILDKEIDNSKEHLEEEKRKFVDSNQHPFIDFSRLEEKYQGKGAGTSMYVYMARKLGEKGKTLSSSGLQSDEAQRLWGSMIKQRGVPTKVTTTVFEKERYKGYSNRFTIDFSKK